MRRRHNKTTIKHFTQADDLPVSAFNLLLTSPRTPVIYFLPEIHMRGSPVKKLVDRFLNQTKLDFVTGDTSTIYTPEDEGVTP